MTGVILSEVTSNSKPLEASMTIVGLVSCALSLNEIVVLALTIILSLMTKLGMSTSNIMPVEALTGVPPRPPAVSAPN